MESANINIDETIQNNINNNIIKTTQSETEVTKLIISLAFFNLKEK